MAARHGAGVYELGACWKARLPGAVLSAAGMDREGFPKMGLEALLGWSELSPLQACFVSNLQVYLSASFLQSEWLHSESGLLSYVMV